MPQPSAPAPPALNADVDQRRDDHAAERGERRQRDCTPVAELADDELALDLHPDDEEEQRHQQVVDDVREVLVEDVRPDLDVDVVDQNDS